MSGGARIYRNRFAPFGLRATPCMVSLYGTGAGRRRRQFSRWGPLPYPLPREFRASGGLDRAGTEER